MYVNKSLQSLLIISGTLAVFCHAQAEEEKNWAAEAELGYFSSSGNTETETLVLKANGHIKRNQWKHSGRLEVINSSDHDETTAERYFIEGKSDYQIDDRNYVFGLISYEEDRFSGYVYQTNEAVGYGRKAIVEPALELDLEIGPGARQFKLDEDDADDESEFTAYAAAKLLWKISATSRFTEHLSIDAAEVNTITKSITALTAKINGNLATKFSYTIKHSSDVPEDVENTDREVAATLVYSFN